MASWTNLWLYHCGGTTLDDEETEDWYYNMFQLWHKKTNKNPVEMTTMLYDYFHVVTVSLLHPKMQLKGLT